MMFANNKVRERLRGVADGMWRSPLIWFSSGCSGDQIVPVSAAFYEIDEALAWASRHPGDFVHFPNGNQLACWAAVESGLKYFRDSAEQKEEIRRMLKPFTKEGRFECGLDEAVQGKVWAFTAVLSKKAHHPPPFALGVVFANEPGYMPVPVHWCHGDDYNEMADHADALNLAEGLSPAAAASIVSSSMRQGLIAPR